MKLYNRKLYNNVLIKMAKKGTRVVVTLECTEARTSSEPRRSNGVSRYTTEKNKRNTTAVSYTHLTLPTILLV